MNSRCRLSGFVLIFTIVQIGRIESASITFRMIPPVNTPVNDTVYISGNQLEFGEWAPDSVKMERAASEIWEFTAEFDSGTWLEYKYTRGNWARVEKGLSGEEITNRVYTVSGRDSVLVDTVLAWQDAPRTKSPWLSWRSSPLNTMTISWETGQPTTGMVVYGLDTVHLDTVFDTSQSYQHVVDLVDLLPSTDYYYRICGPNGFKSRTSIFTTGCHIGEPFTFVVYGDNRSNAGIHRRITAAIMDAEPAFVLNTGDLVDHGYNQRDWYLFFNTIPELLGKIPYMPTLGNHENNSTNYFSLFSLPGNERWYSFEFSNTHFIALSTEENYSSGSAQYDWLSQNLSSISDSIDWVFVYLHRPPYTSGTTHGSDLGVRNALSPLFEEYGVDVVFSGHEHNYERSLVGNVYYIVTGGGGAPLYPVGTGEWTICSESAYHFCTIEVADTLLHFEAIRLDGTIMDSFTIKKTPNSQSRSSIPYLWGKSGSNPFREVVKLSLVGSGEGNRQDSGMR